MQRRIAVPACVQARFPRLGPVLRCPGAFCVDLRQCRPFGTILVSVMMTMETLAITCWKGIVSPLYDASCRLMVVRADGGRSMVNVQDLTLFERAEVCLKQSVSVVICGAISGVAHTLLSDRGIDVLPWIRGPVEDLIDAYRNGADLRAAYAMPGCGRGRCARGSRGRWRGGVCGR